MRLGAEKFQLLTPARIPLEDERGAEVLLKAFANFVASPFEGVDPLAVGAEVSKKFKPQGRPPTP